MKRARAAVTSLPAIENCDRRDFLQALAVMVGTMSTTGNSVGATSLQEVSDRSSRTESDSGLIVVTAPRGQIGRQLLTHLLASGSRVRVIDRDPSRLPAEVRERVETVPGSHGEFGVVDAAFAGVDAVFWLCPPDARSDSVEKAYLDFTRPAARAIRRHNVAHVVSVSALGRGTVFEKRAGYVTASLAADDLLADTGAHFRALAMPSFMDNVLRQVQSIRTQGVFVSTIDADLKAPTCATRDIAAVAAKLLIDRSWAGSGSVPVLGPEDLSCNDMARIMSDVLGKPVRYRQISFADFKAGLLKNGMSAAMAQAMTEMMEAKNQGLDNAQPRTPEATTPTTFRQWCVEELKPAVLT
jgi:uncharacterized protein YbjT (DUF2867 family)